MSDSKVDLELGLAKRMAGEVYPELLLLMKKTKVAVVFIRALDEGVEEEISPVRFTISEQGIIKDLCLSSCDDEIEGEVNQAAMDMWATMVIGEADDCEDDYVPKELSIQNVDECPIYNNYENIDYAHYCEQVLNVIDGLFEKNKRVHNVMERINRIPYRKFVIIEKTKK